VDAFLADWSGRSRQVRVEGRTGWDRESQWLVTRLGKRERRWGRLVVQCPTPPSSRLVAVAERAAAALALHRLHDRHRDSLVRRSHHELLLALMSDPTPEVLRRCELAGVPHERRVFVGLSIRPRPRRATGRAVPGTVLDEVIAAVVHATHELAAPALVSPFDQDIRVLLSLPRSTGVDRVVDQVAARVSRRHDVVVAAGRPASTLTDLGRTLREAQQVVEAVRGDAAVTVVRLDDVHLRGLLTLLGDDERVAMFAARELQSLRTHDATHGTHLVDAVRALVTNPAGKTAAAASLHVSRPVFYDRLAKAEKVVGASLDDPDIRVSLHVALVADELGLGSSS
jgi:purine catabolism regulator